MYLYPYELYVSGRCVKTLVGVVVGGGGGCGKGRGMWEGERHTKWWQPGVRWKRNERVYNIIYLCIYYMYRG